MITEQKQKELANMAVSLIPVPDDMIFTAEEAKYLVNCKVSELETIMEDKIEEYRKQINETEDERVNNETRDVVLEYIDMIEDETDFEMFAQI